MAYKLGVDTGGTFTDLVMFDDEKKTISITKVPSTPANPAVGILNGVYKITDMNGIEPKDISFFIHGTTVATNAILEQKGARTGFLVTGGFKDVLGIVRQDRPMMYDFFARRPEALIPRHLRFEISERVAYDGTVLRPLDECQVAEIAKKLREMDVKAVAVCLLHSYANTGHEKRVKEILAEHLPGIKISISSEILPEFREYERMSTTILNSYVHPVMEDYLTDLAVKLSGAGMRKDLHVMQSNGGIMTRKTASEKCIHTAVSGPAAGVVGGVYLARLAGYENVITVDMGGTSFDICLAYQGEIRLTKETQIGGHSIKVPMIDINTIGAGGGSIGWIDAGGALRVGPQSAGADPGPACYGLGGIEPTVTDANLALGRINKGYYLGGEMAVDVEKSRAVIGEKIAGPFGMSLEEAAEGIIKVVNANMVKGIRVVSVERGYDPREFALVSFGGGGSLHACELAEELGVGRVIVPPAPGVTSAWGLLMADFRHVFSRTYLKAMSELDLEDLNEIYRAMEAEALATMESERVDHDVVVLQRKAEVRYVGQGYQIEVSLPPGRITGKEISRMLEEFHARHEDTYGYKMKDAETSVVTVEVTAIGRMPRPEMRQFPPAGEDASAAVKEERKVFIKGRYMATKIYDRELLQPGNVFAGPAVIEQKDTTTLVLPGQKCVVDSYKNLIISLRKGGE